MVAGIDLGIDLLDYTFFVDQKAHPFRILRARVRACTKCDRKRAGAVAEQRESELVLARERGVFDWRIEATPTTAILFSSKYA